MRLSLGYPSARDEVAMVLNRQGTNPLQELVPLLNRDTLVSLQETVAATHVHPDVVQYAVALINATRNDENILRGASPRATLATIAMAKALAQLRGRDYVLPEDIKEVFVPTITHRLLLSPKAEGAGKTAGHVLQDILAAVDAPKLN